LRGEGQGLAAEYPLVFGDRAAGQQVTVQQDGRPVAGLAILRRTLLCRGVHLPVGLIGSVATDPAYRGRGYASAVLEEAERVLEGAGCAMALLWADEADFYSARGWAPVGTEVNHALPPAAAALLPSPLGVRRYRGADGPLLHSLYCTHETRVARSEEETVSLLAAPGMTTLVLERDGAVCAYACEGRGADLGGAIHEWAGAPLDVLALIRAHLERAGGPLVLMSPPSASGVLHYLEALGVESRTGVLGMGKLLSTQAAAQVLHSACPEALVEATDTGVELTGPLGSVALSRTETLLTLAGPPGLRGVVVEAELKAGCPLAGLPLEPFCWGLDSI